MLVQEVLKRRVSALRVFANGVFQSPILGDLGRVIKIYKASCDAKIVQDNTKIVQDYTKIIWDCGMVLSVALGRDYTGKIETVDWGK